MSPLAGGRDPPGCSQEGTTKGSPQVQVEVRSFLLISISLSTRATETPPAPNTKPGSRGTPKPAARPWGTASGPQAGKPPLSCDSRKHSGNKSSPGSWGENVQQMKMCGAGAFITHQLHNGPFGDETPFSFTKDLSSFV